MHSEFRCNHRQNILVQDMQVKQWSDMVSLEAKIVTSGLPKASVLDSFELVIRPYCVSDQIVQTHCVQDKLPIFQLTNGIVALEAAFNELHLIVGRLRLIVGALSALCKSYVFECS